MDRSRDNDNLHRRVAFRVTSEQLTPLGENDSIWPRLIQTSATGCPPPALIREADKSSMGSPIVRLGNVRLYEAASPNPVQVFTLPCPATYSAGSARDLGERTRIPRSATTSRLRRILSPEATRIRACPG